MGLLDSSDADVKNQLLYKKAVQAGENLEEKVENFKQKGGTSGLVRPVAQAIVHLIQSVDRGWAKYPDFKEWEKMRAPAIDVGKALLDKYPNSATSFKKFIDDPKLRA